MKNKMNVSSVTCHVSSVGQMDCVILCGGLGTRLRSEIGESQKVLAPVEDRPFLDLIINYLKDQNIKRIILASGYKSDLVLKYIREKEKNVQIEFEISDEPEPLGTGGAVACAKIFIKSDPFIVVNGDSFCEIDYSKLLKNHLDKKAFASIVVAKIKNGKDYGRIDVNGREEVVGFFEKNDTAKGEYVNVGIYCFSRKVLSPSYLGGRSKSSIENDLFTWLPNKEKVCAFITDQPFYDIGTPERYEKAKEILGKKK